MSWLASLARPEILALSPYEHAASELGLTRLNANELPWRALDDRSLVGLNRYPEPQPNALIGRLAALYNIAPDSLLVCRGSDEAIDLLVRGFCRPGKDAILVTPPTFGMYAIAGYIQGAEVRTVPLIAEAGFALDTEAVVKRASRDVKLVFFCSPNNPTGNLLSDTAILQVADALSGRAIVVVDEAYIEFASRESLTKEVARRPQLAVLRTLSKAHGLAGARLGTLIADPELITLLRKIVTPFGLPHLVVETAIELLTPAHITMMNARIVQVRAERLRLQGALAELRAVRRVLESEANFLLARFQDPEAALRLARSAGLLVRDVRKYLRLSDALRITIGAPEENDRLLEAWG